MAKNGEHEKYANKYDKIANQQIPGNVKLHCKEIGRSN